MSSRLGSIFLSFNLFRLVFFVFRLCLFVSICGYDFAVNHTPLREKPERSHVNGSICH